MRHARDSKKNSHIPRTTTTEHKHRQLRAILTREQLIASARVIFARDGFEHASLVDIAALAGKTRGAFYDNFQSKEEIFFAIFEEDIERDREKMRAVLRTSSTLEGRLDLLAEYLVSLASNSERTLLYTDFKTYAIRHPEHRGLLADLHAAMRMRCSLPEIDELVPAMANQTDAEKRALSLAIGGILDGLAVNNLFDPGVLDRLRLQRYLRICIDEAISFVTKNK